MVRSKKRRLLKRFLLLGGVMVIGFVCFHFYVLYRYNQIANISVEFGKFDEYSPSKTEKEERIFRTASNSRDRNRAYPNDLSAFKEVDVLDEDAKDWSTIFAGYACAGALVFDANGDDRPDLYLTHHNDTWVRPTDENAVIQEKPRISGNGLYLNMGNDAYGVPQFSQVKDLVKENDQFAEAELLIENLLFPRQGSQDEVGIGRRSSCATAVDLNNDGRLDLLVGNTLPGMLWSHEKTQRVMGQFVRPVGREAVNSKIPLQAQGLYFVHDYQAGNETDDIRETIRGTEFMGANSIYLNMGDQDGDGVPEWEDISRSSGLEGKRSTQALLAFDLDLDGDLDVFEANSMDEDYWPGGAKAHAGGANQLYINQLAETGELKFIERSAEMNIDGVYDTENPMPDYYRLYQLPILPNMYSVGLAHFTGYQPDILELNGEKSEAAQISWCAITQDVDEDGYPDIWVANDIGYLRLYMNEEGKSFKEKKDHVRSEQTGYWMSLAPADFNGDLKEDLFAGNMGGSSMNIAVPIPDPNSLFEPVLTTSTLMQQIFGDHHNSLHALIDGSDHSTEMKAKVQHSNVLQPDASLPNNVRKFSYASNPIDYDQQSLDPYEFAWGATIVDVQNDGLNDLYWVGCLYGRGGGIFPIMGTGPGRLLVNTTETPKQLKFSDQTAEHHLFNIQELQYDKLSSEGYIYRKSPLQNWGKRSIVRSYDVSVWGFQGAGIIERVTNSDLVQTAENGRAAVSADLNGDGFADIIVRNMGGYDSRSSNSKNLKASVNGQHAVIPAHDANFPSPTNFEPGSTRMFINSYSDNNWLKVRLVDDTPESYNRDAIGARIVLNNEQMKVLRSGSGGFASLHLGPLIFGLGKKEATQITVHWPDRTRTVTQLDLPQYSNGLLTIYKTGNRVEWAENTLPNP